MADKYVCMLSDATGGTAERVVRATLAQFPDSTVVLEVISGVENAGQMQAVVDKAKSSGGLIAAWTESGQRPLSLGNRPV